MPIECSAERFDFGIVEGCRYWVSSVGSSIDQLRMRHKEGPHGEPVEP